MHTYTHILTETRPTVKPESFNSSHSTTSSADAPPPKWRSVLTGWEGRVSTHLHSQSGKINTRLFPYYCKKVGVGVVVMVFKDRPTAVVWRGLGWSGLIRSCARFCRGWWRKKTHCRQCKPSSSCLSDWVCLVHSLLRNLNCTTYHQHRER